MISIVMEVNLEKVKRHLKKHEKKYIIGAGLVPIALAAKAHSVLKQAEKNLQSGLTELDLQDAERELNTRAQIRKQQMSPPTTQKKKIVVGNQQDRERRLRTALKGNYAQSLQRRLKNKDPMTKIRRKQKMFNSALPGYKSNVT